MMANRYMNTKKLETLGIWDCMQMLLCSPSWHRPPTTRRCVTKAADKGAGLVLLLMMLCQTVNALSNQIDVCIHCWDIGSPGKKIRQRFKYKRTDEQGRNEGGRLLDRLRCDQLDDSECANAVLAEVVAPPTRGDSGRQ